jgi:hypothetical protein
MTSCPELSLSKPSLEPEVILTSELAVVIQYQDILAGVQEGDIVQVRYRDHVLFRDVDASLQEPRVMECIGRVNHVDRDYIRVSFETYNNPDPSGETTVRSTGLVILESTILDLRKIQS